MQLGVSKLSKLSWQDAHDEDPEVAFVLAGTNHATYAWPVLRKQQGEIVQLDLQPEAEFLVIPITNAELVRVCPVLNYALENSCTQGMKGKTISMQIDRGLPVLQFARRRLVQLSFGQIQRLMEHCQYHNAELLSVADKAGMWLRTFPEEFTEEEVVEIVEQLRLKERSKQEGQDAQQEEDREETPEEKEEREMKELKEAEEAGEPIEVVAGDGPMQAFSDSSKCVLQNDSSSKDHEAKISIQQDSCKEHAANISIQQN